MVDDEFFVDELFTGFDAHGFFFVAAQALQHAVIFIFSAQIKMLAVLGSRNTQDLLYNLTIFVLYVIILTFILRFLWNGTLVKHISILRPVDTLLQTFLLALGISLFRL
jgi:hypothetical protein